MAGQFRYLSLDTWVRKAEVGRLSPLTSGSYPEIQRSTASGRGKPVGHPSQAVAQSYLSVPPCRASRTLSSMLHKSRQRPGFVRKLRHCHDKRQGHALPFSARSRIYCSASTGYYFTHLMTAAFSSRDVAFLDSDIPGSSVSTSENEKVLTLSVGLALQCTELTPVQQLRLKVTIRLAEEGQGCKQL